MKRIAFMLVSLFFMGNLLIAQNVSRESRLSARERADYMTEKMADKYSLTDTQRQHLLELNREKADEWGDRFDFDGERNRENLSTEEWERRREEMRTHQNAYNDRVKNILTNDQYNNFLQDQNQKMDKIRDKMRDRTPRR